MMIDEIFSELVKDQKLKTTLEKVLSMRTLGNKFHGDTFEVAMTFLISKKTSFSAIHVGKDFFRSGKDYDIVVARNEEDIINFITITKSLGSLKNASALTVKNLCNLYEIKYTNKKNSIEELNVLFKHMLDLYNEKVETVSLKCYGKGPLQLTTSSDGKLIDICFSNVPNINVETEIPVSILDTEPFQVIKDDGPLSCIYDEKRMKYSLLKVKIGSMYNKVSKIIYYPRIQKKKGFTYQIFKFFDNNENYLFEVRYGKKDANALQRGLWTKTETEKNEAFNYIIFDETYEVNISFLNEFRESLIS